MNDRRNTDPDWYDREAAQKAIRNQYKPIFDRVNTFIQRVHDTEYLILPEARNIELKNRYDQKSNLAAELGREMHAYEKNLCEDWLDATYLLGYIDMAFTHGVVKDNEEVWSQKAKEYEKQVLSLKEQLKELREKHDKQSDDFVFIQGKYDELKELFDRMVPKKKDDPLE